MRLVDSHCHLQADRFEGDVDDVIAAARDAGVERLLVPGWDLASSRAAVDLTERHPWLDAAVGIHPHDAAKAGAADWAAVARLARDPRVAAIGETGLDYDRVFSPIPDQLASLRRHLALALDLGKPAILHVRSPAGDQEAQDAIDAELRAAGFGTQAAIGAFGDHPAAVIHSFSGSVEYARRILDLGLAVSISGLAFRAGEEATADVAALVPLESLLVETDSPFLSPPGAPRRRNEPRHVRITAEWLAERRGVAVAELGDRLVEAYARTFPRGIA